jgi:putative component of membrane protein insertase Oxa1/YidC/SpoIIIJ protein YidD
MPVIATAAVGAIGVYQRYISPYKGFRCAHRVYCRGLSCSEFAQQVIHENGLLNAIPKIRRRFCECREAYVALQSLQAGAESADDNEPSAHDLTPGRPQVDSTPPEGGDGGRLPPRSALTKQGDCCVNVCTLPCL